MSKKRMLLSVSLRPRSDHHAICKDLCSQLVPCVPRTCDRHHSLGVSDQGWPRKLLPWPGEDSSSRQNKRLGRLGVAKLK
eukprot:CAMPEP_0172825762 /NCGR_PEP_ID=MMETSP1075-20121228/18917_1 /TAXON_ID=2916 /ORGANISM="Ceratium fusus, Strain PA161109" /LENGTH=79 /DNA_ID=CAMNT_0013667263 /DNA_START=246 /DNA_END=482 /DNA_ORIENTATION=+